MIHRPLMLSLLAAALLAAVPALAFDLRATSGTNTVIIPPTEELPKEALIIGQDIEFHGKALRDLWLGANAIEHGGDIRGDLRLLSRSAVLDGRCRQNVLAYAAGLQLTTNSVIQRDAALFGNHIICEGRVEGDAWILAKSVTLGGVWGGHVRVQAEEIRVAPDTQIAGDLVYAGSKEPVLDSTVVLGGQLRPREPLPTDIVESTGAVFRNRLWLHGFLFMGALLVGMPFIGFFPLLAGRAVQNLRARPWRVFLTGVVAVLLTPPLILFAAMTGIGLPLGLMLGALFFLLAYLSHIVVALWLGHRLMPGARTHTFGSVLSALAVGLFLLYFIAALPNMARFIALPVIVLGMGALITARPARPTLVPPPPPPLSDSPDPYNPPQA
ncbi:MAG: fatty acid desaturase [Lentisphaerae bacterium]|nr:fatty acid desaturase [Lentisphaerota bacterium]